MYDCNKCLYYGNCLILHIQHEHSVPEPSDCYAYKDSSQFIDVAYKDNIVVFPCKIGDIGYFIVGEHILEDVVHSFLVYKDHIMIKTAKGYDLFPEWFHLSQEEAEKELEKQQQDCRTVIKL